MQRFTHLLLRELVDALGFGGFSREGDVMDIDLEELAAIVELLDKTEFTDFQFEKGDLRIRVRRGGVVDEPAATSAAAPQATAQQVAQPPPAPTKPAKPAGAPEPAAAQTSPEIADGDVVVTAPMLGTFYRSPKPGEAPFVEIGDKVGADSVLCIVEAMKLMNSVPAGTQGEITAILAQDGDLLDFDQPLFAIRPLA